MVHCINLGVTGYTFQKKVVFSFSEDRLCLSKQCRPWWNAAICGISSGASLFANLKVTVKRFLVYEGLNGWAGISKDTSNGNVHNMTPMQGFRFFQNWWAEVTHGAKNRGSYSEMIGPCISILTQLTWVVYCTYTHICILSAVYTVKSVLSGHSKKKTNYRLMQFKRIIVILQSFCPSWSYKLLLRSLNLLF